MTTAVDTLYARPAAAATGSGDSGAFDTSRALYTRLDVNIVSFTGGTTPSITFTIQVQGGDGRWYDAYSTAALTATGATSVNFGLGVNSVVWTGAARIAWTFGGAVVATSINFSVSFIGRS